MLLLIIVILLFTGYSILIIYYHQNWNSLPAYSASNKAPSLSISVIIPARNEEKNIGNLLQALSEQSYPKELYEIIVVDDHSEDSTAAIVSEFKHIKLLSLKEDGINSYKKKAIEKGISNARYSLIVTTDADCIPSPYWLQTLAAFKEEKKAVFITAPVVFENNTSLLQVFQSLDFLTLQGITGASVHRGTHSMCNGANLAYDKEVFYEVNGFSDIDHIASGDDMLLMYKICKKYPGGAYYLKSKDAMVSTKPMETWKQFFNQRIRWASKAKYYDDKRIFAVLLLVYLFNLSFLALLILGCLFPVYWLWLAGLWIAKTIVEFPFVFSVARFFNKQRMMWYFFFFQPLHILYTLVSGFLGQTSKYEWKGRVVR